MSNILRSLGPTRLAAVAAVMLGVLGFFMFLITRAASPDMGLLFSQLEPSDASEIVEKIQAKGIPVEARAGGSQVFVPSDQISKLRMDMAMEGLPSGGAVGYEIFDRADTLGISNALININKIRAMEGELAKSIRSIDGISAARVHLVVPKRELFSKTQSMPSASIVLKMNGGRKLTAQQSQSILSLVSAAVPNLSFERISIVDQRGNILAKNSGDPDSPAAYGNQQENQAAYERKLANTIESLLEKSVGKGKVRAEVTADMDFDRITINSEEYDPNGQVVRSTSTAEDKSQNSGSGSAAVSIENALPDEGGAGGGGGGNSSSNSNRTEETVNYEISKTIKQHIKETGTIKKISVAVLVDGVYEVGDDGKEAYKERPQAELDKLTQLVQTAIGFDTERGDKVSVVNMPFERQAVEELEESSSFLDKLNLTRAIELSVIAIVGLLVMLMVVRPMMLRMIESAGSNENLLESSAAAGAEAGGAAQLAGPDGATVADSVPEQEEEVYREVSPIVKVAEIVDKNPDEVVALIRNWMNS